MPIITDTPPTTAAQILCHTRPGRLCNQGLADARANAVAQYYIDNGIDESRVSAIGLVALEGDKSGPINTLTIPFCNEDIRDSYIEAQRQQYQR